MKFAHRLSSRILRGGGWRSPTGTVALATAVLIATLLAMPAAQAASTGQVVGTGYNGYGQLCNGSTTGGSTAAGTVSPLDASVTVTAMAAGAVHSLALTSAGTVFACGRNNFGQLGNGTTTDSPTPVAVTLPGGATATAVAADEFHSLALTSAGTVYAWGHNAFGQLGAGSTAAFLTTATPLASTASLGAIATGAYHSLAVSSGGAPLAWGDNAAGQLGDGTTTDRSSPVSPLAPATSPVSGIATGWAHSLFVK